MLFKLKMSRARILATGIVFITAVAAGHTLCPLVCTCPSLYRADCCNASLTHIPRNLGSDVRYLNATGNNFISLRKGAFSVHRIKILDLCNNRISAIEIDAVRELEDLIFLYLSRNEIDSLDQEVFRMNRRLEFLKLDNNVLNLPRERPFLNIPSLRSLDISACSVTFLPKETFVKVSSLEELRLANNKLQTLHRDVFLHLKSLKYLYLSHNLLKVLHKNLFVMLKKLEILDLSSNELQALHPQVFAFLESVELLKLSGNRLKTLESGVFTPLISLERLYLDKNVLNILNGSQFSELSNLQALDISGNQLDNSQLNLICYLTNLTYLKVSDNRLACDCALWQFWKWSLEKKVRVFSTCDESDFEFSVKNFESLAFNYSCNSTICDVRNETEFSEEILFPMYLYIIISVSLLLLLITFGTAFFLGVRYFEEFCKRRNKQVTLNDYPRSTVSYVGRQNNECVASEQGHKIKGDLHHHEKLRNNNVKIGHSVSLKALPTLKHGNIRHSYHEYRVRSVAHGDGEWSNTDTLPSGNRSSVFLQSMCNHTPKLEKRKESSSLEPKRKACRKVLSANETSSHTSINPLSVSTLDCKTSLEAPRVENVNSLSSSESETATVVERL